VTPVVSPGPTRVLLACDFFWPSVGGVELYVEDLGVRLQEAGCTVEVAARALPGRTAREHRGMRIHEFDEARIDLEASRVLDNREYREVAERAARFILDTMRDENGRLLRTWKADPGVAKLKEIASSGELGDIHYIYSNRLNLGKLRADENALWSLGAHDVSVLLHLAGEEPYEVEARGESYMRPGIEDVVFGFLRFPSGLAAHLHLSWLDPHKERRFTVVGSRRMATFDDMDLERKVTVFDKGFDQSASTWGEYITRSGDIWSPSVSNREPLRLECEHFVECLREGRAPISDGRSGLRVVRVLAALQEQLDVSRREQRAAV